MANTEDLTELRRSVDGLSKDLKESQEDRRTLHRRSRAQTVGLAVLAIAAGLSSWAAISAHSASDTASAASKHTASVAHATYESCLANNETRADTRQLWAAVVNTLQPLTVSPSGKLFIANIEHDVEVTTTPRVCRPA